MSQRSRALFLPLLAVLAVGSACELGPPTGPASGPAASNQDTASLSNPPPLGPIAHALGGPLSLLTPRQRLLFERGRAEFQTEFTPATGLGPLFNNVSCAECHEAPVVGGVGEEVETHQSAFNGSTCDDLSAIGGPVIQDSVTPALPTALHIDQAGVLPEAPRTSHRTTPTVFGF